MRPYRVARMNGHIDVIHAILMAADIHMQHEVPFTIDACADVMLPAWRVALAAELGFFIRLLYWHSIPSTSTTITAQQPLVKAKSGCLDIISWLCYHDDMSIEKS